jgi:hypothetical protein
MTVVTIILLMTWPFHFFSALIQLTIYYYFRDQIEDYLLEDDDVGK